LTSRKWKLERIKTINTSRIINTIMLNIKINLPKLVSMRGYKLATNERNFMEIYLALVKLLQKVLGTTFFIHNIHSESKNVPLYIRSQLWQMLANFQKFFHCRSLHEIWLFVCCIPLSLFRCLHCSTMSAHP